MKLCQDKTTKSCEGKGNPLFSSLPTGWKQWSSSVRDIAGDSSHAEGEP